MDDTVEDEEKLINIVSYSTANVFFDQVIGHIESIILSQEFVLLRENFLRKYCMQFDDDEENKLEYMDIYEEYSKIFETFFNDKLLELMPDFDINRFNDEMSNCECCEGSMDFQESEIYDLLRSFHNFQSFKELMLDYRKKLDGHMKHLESDLLIVIPLNLSNSDTSKSS